MSLFSNYTWQSWTNLGVTAAGLCTAAAWWQEVLGQHHAAIFASTLTTVTGITNFIVEKAKPQ